MVYHTHDGVISKLVEDLYDDTILDDRILETENDVIAWINSACRRTVDFTEEELVGDDDIIRLASCCYSAFRVMSDQLEGHDIKTESLAVFRFNETHLLGKATNRDISQLQVAGLVSKSGDKVSMVPAAQRRRERRLERRELDEMELDLDMPKKRHVKRVFAPLCG